MDGIARSHPHHTKGLISMGHGQDGTPGSGQLYEIRTVADFLMVPPERRALCLSEFQTWLEMADATREIVAALPGIVEATFGTDGFKWVDDDKGEARINVEVVTKFAGTR
jgi:hypothetical protein